MKDQELEVKFLIADLPALENRLGSLGAQLVQQRVHEVNLRLDTPDLSLTKSLQVLRLRQDSLARVTYKGPGRDLGGVRIRQELEFVVSDFETARNLFKALGYDVAMMYEKYRTVYDLDDVHVTLDEMPYGDFIEVEGPLPESIQRVSQRLGVAWEARVLDSYTALFDQLRAVMGFTFRDLSFENFSGVKTPLMALGYRFADTPSPA
jgi:adenylate cyclase, class 2